MTVGKLFGKMNTDVRRHKMSTVTDDFNTSTKRLRKDILQEQNKISGKVSLGDPFQGTGNRILSIVSESPPIYAWQPVGANIIMRDTTTGTSNNANAIWKLTIDDQGQFVQNKLS